MCEGGRLSAEWQTVGKGLNGPGRRLRVAWSLAVERERDTDGFEVCPPPPFMISQML